MSTNEPPKLGNTTIDIITSLAKGTTGMIPYVGSLVAEIVGNVIPNQRVDRIVQFVQLLEERLGNIEKDGLEKRLREPAAVDLLEDAFTQAARATSRERLEHVANVIANGLSDEELQQAEAKRMLWLLGQINDSEVIILRSRLVLTREDVQADAEFRNKHAELLAPDATHMGSSVDDFDEAALKSSYRQHLHDLGLLRSRFAKPKRGELPEFDEKTGMMKASGADVTRLGKMLLRYLSLIPNWYRH
ncbi:MAG: hypothetical protein KGQ60_01290 [Planctomycetes bacterium]|nr:hypothetical protein [Planctomycetota bacterium]